MERVVADAVLGGNGIKEVIKPCLVYLHTISLDVLSRHERDNHLHTISEVVAQYTGMAPKR